ncbi:DUF4277 domain-containing protein [Salmonella enterica]|nr:DUF4277 domain-containing protein [Salmonella enterica]
MHLNGPGIHRCILHMFPLFFTSKPVEHRICPGIEAKDLNNDVSEGCPGSLPEAGASLLSVYMMAISGNSNDPLHRRGEVHLPALKPRRIIITSETLLYQHAFP